MITRKPNIKPVLQKPCRFFTKVSVYSNKTIDFHITSFQYGDFGNQFEQPPESHCLLNLLVRSVTKTAAFRFAERLFSDGNVKWIPENETDYVNLFRSRSMSIFSDQPLDGMDIWLRGKANRSNEREPILLYSNLNGLPAIFQHKQEIPSRQRVTANHPN